ncbi:hypothetical protein LG307_20440 [Sutcliffiella horikoshii]|uniref:hypothetical protein n=1 Tax=Sutcliffiella horikoshii TaxID=79883 RepID=UPI003851610F
MSNQVYRMKEIDNEKSKDFHSLEKQSIHKSFQTHEAGFSGRFIVLPNSEELTAESVLKIETPKKNKNKESYKIRIDNQRDREKLE